MNRKKGIVTVIIILLVIGILFGVLLMLQLRANHFQKLYTSKKEQLANPSRGFYVQVDSADAEEIETLQRDGVRLVFVAFDIEAYKAKPISNDKLNELSYILGQVKKYNMKAIVRSAYGFTRSENNDADTFHRIEQHIDQIAPVVNHHADSILCVQAGFLGPWGEWHSSKYLETDEKTAVQNRNRLLDKLLKSYVETIIIDVRRPRFIREAKSAGLEVSRLGIHNDGLLSSETDLGTYDAAAYSRENELNFVANNVLTGINGGEMPKVSEYTEVQNVIKEFSKLKITYLNLKYNTEVLNTWKQDTIGDENAFDYIEQRIGYRYFISESQSPTLLYSSILKMLQQFQISIKNEGFAPISNEYKPEWVIEPYVGTIYTIPADIILNELEHEEEKTLTLSARKLKAGQIKRIGLRFYDADMGNDKNASNVEFSNAKIPYEQGVNYIFHFDPDGNLESLH